jgi:perosamine synthetase
VLYYPRNNIDITLRVVLKSIWLGIGFVGPDVRKQLEDMWSPKDVTKAYLSVRTGYDLLLRALPNLSKNDEVLISAITIPAMWQIPEQLGCKTVGVDIESRTLGISLADLKKKITHRSKALVITHTFGTANDNTEAIIYAKNKGLYVIEDCAQCYHGFGFYGNPLSDVSMFSFGPLKTASSFAGALFHFSANPNNKKIVTTMDSFEAGYQILSRGWLVSRSLSYGVKSFLQKKYSYYMLNYLLRLVGVDIDALVVGSTRAFKSTELLQQIRKRPPMALYVLMKWRLSSYDSTVLQAKVNRTIEYRSSRDNEAKLVGSDAKYHTAWLQPIIVDDPHATVKSLRKHGIDGSLVATALATHPDDSVDTARNIIGRTVYVPFQHKMSNSARGKGYELCDIKNQQLVTVHDWPKFCTYNAILCSPNTYEELADIISLATKENAVVRVFGRGKSMNGGLGSLCKPTYSVSLSKFDTIEVDSFNKTAVVGAGCKWGDLQKALEPLGLAPLVQQSADDFTVGGSIAAGVHGRDIYTSRIIDSIIWVEAMDEHGQIRRYDGVGLSEIVGIIGMSSITVKAKLRLSPNSALKTSVNNSNVDKFFSTIQDGSLLGDAALFIARPTLSPDKNFGSIQSITWSTVEGAQTPQTNFSGEGTQYISRLVFGWSRGSKTGKIVRSYLEENIQKKSNSSKHISRISAMRPPVVPLAVLKTNHAKYFDHVQEFFVPISNAKDFYLYLSAKLKGQNIIGYTLRFVSVPEAEDELAFMLYFATKRNDLELYKVGLFINEIAVHAASLGGRPYLAYAYLLDKSIIRKRIQVL